MDWHFLPEQNYDCIGCGHSCINPWIVQIDEQRAQAVLESGDPLLPSNKRQLLKGSEDGLVVHKDECRRCSFLLPDNRCTIHSALGGKAKPVVCQTYPYTVAVTPAGCFVGVTFSCSSALENSGRPLSEHRPAIEEYLDHYTTHLLGFQPTPFAEGSSLLWDGYLVMERRLEENFAAAGCQLGLWGDLLRFGQFMTQLEQPQELGPEIISQVFERPVPTLEGELVSMLQQSSLMPLCVAAGSTAENSTDVLSADCPVIDFPRVGWSGSSQQLQAVFNNIAPDLFEEEIQRFLRAFLFQKYLLASGQVMTSLALMAHIPQILRQLASLLADAQGVAPDIQHFRTALRIVEEDLVTHNHSCLRIFGSIVRLIGMMLQHCESAS